MGADRADTPDDDRAAFWARGRAAWPDLACEERDFWALAEPCRARMAGARADAAVGWAEVNAGDLYLVAAVLADQPGAARAFEQAYLAPTRGALARLGLSEAATADALQIVSERMLVASAEAPARIVDQVGDGNLGALFRVVAIRTGLNLRRGDRHLDLEDDAVCDRLVATHTPEQQLLAAEARALLRSAMAAAVAGLPRRDRTLLRLHVFHGLSIDELGRMYDVHRSTAARWLGKIHAQLDERTRSELARRLDTASDHLESVLALARSGLASGFEQIWRSLDTPPPAA